MAATIIGWGAESALFPAANPAQAAFTSGTNFPWMSLNFDPTTAEKVYFFGIFPQSYAEGNLTVRIFWTTAGTLNVVWGVKFLGRIDDEVWDAALSSQATVTDATTAALDMMVASVSLTTPAIDAGDMTIWEISRVAADASDTNASDAKLLFVEIQE